MSEANTAHSHDAAHDGQHRLPIFSLFLALSALTAAEVGLFEVWSRSETFQSHLPKFALVLLILVFTIPKALIVLIYFMHLKFEKQFVVFLAIVPFPFVAIAILPTLIDAQTLRGWGSAENQVPSLKDIKLDHGDGHSMSTDGAPHHEGTLGEQGQHATEPAGSDDYPY
jgi:heme/copper-type cytochrome/quinol oxidase subunit 4